MTRQGPDNTLIAERPSMLILQPTSLCNLDCTYCYLPARKSRNEMSASVAQAVADGIQDDWADTGPVEVVWHGGEPLAVGPRKFEELLEPFSKHRQNNVVQHVVQTNATLITDGWCEIFRDHDIGVGVSLDGPGFLNGNRVDWQGRQALNRIVAGLERLSSNRIDFNIMAVVDRGARGQVAEILDYLSSFSPTSIAINLEQYEGVNDHNQSPSPGEAQSIWRDVFLWSKEKRKVSIREVDRLLEYLANPLPSESSAAAHDPLPTVAWNGDVTVLSPELLGIKSRPYNDFVTGNVLTDPLPRILASLTQIRYVQEFETSVRGCEASCDFFSFCQGGEAGNRFFEHGNFSVTETHHCRISIQALVSALVDIADEPEVQ